MRLFGFPERNFAKYFQKDLERIKEILGKKKIIFKTLDEAKNDEIFLKYARKEIIDKANGGIFIYVPDNTKIRLPISLCYISEKEKQIIYNLVVTGKNSYAKIYVGCLSSKNHTGISDYYIGEKSNVDIIKIHRNYSKIISNNRIKVGNDSNVKSFYISLENEGNEIIQNIFDLGENAKLSERSVVFSRKGNVYFKTDVNLKKNSSSELITKSVTLDSDIKIELQTTALEKAKGYSSCDGIILGNGSIESIPKITSHSKDSEIYHEASIGKINEDAILYLMSRGIEEEKAREIYIKGFLIEDLPELDPAILANIKIQLSKIKGL